MKRICISGSGLYTPEASISNEDLVIAYNAYAERENAVNAEAIAADEAQALPMSSAEFIVKASGIRARHAVDRLGVLDPRIMSPRIGHGETTSLH